MNSSLQLFGATIRALRKAKQLSQEELADLCDLHRTYISSIEQGKRNVSLINILILADALEVLPVRLLEAFDEEYMAHMKKVTHDCSLP